MNYRMMGKFLSQLMALEAIFLIPAFFISLGYGETASMLGIGCTVGIIAVLAGLLYLLCRRAGKRFGARDGLACVGLAWVALSLLGALPFVISGTIPKYIDAFFETVSGFTTTGASILADVESLPKGLLYWRSFTHWVGGMGVLVFLLAIAPGGKDSGFTMHLLRAESPGPDVGKLVPKMRHTAMILYVIYIVMTVVNLIFLLCRGDDYGSGTSGFQFLQNFPSPADDGIGNAGQFGNLDTEAVIGGARHDFSQENHLIAPLFHRDIVVFHIGQLFFQSGKLMVVGGKQGFGPQFFGVGSIFQHCLGDGHTVISGGAAANFVQNQQTAGSGMLQNGSHLRHLHHKGGLAGS